jgi:hypothetical protein
VTEGHYAPPAADLRGPAPFFAVSQAKLLVMALTTVGVYEFWWLHKNWIALRERSDRRTSAFWRTYLAFPFFIHSFLSRVAREGAARDLEISVSPGVCAAAYLALYVPMRLTIVGAFVPCIPLMPANALLRRLNETLAPGAPALARWTWLNVAWALLALAVLALGILEVAASR